MSYSYLTIEFNTFSDAINEHILTANGLLAKTLDTPEAENLFVEEYKNWNDSVILFLENSFEDKFNLLRNEFYQIYSQSSRGNTRTLDTKVLDLKRTIQDKISHLRYNLKIISACACVKDKSKCKEGSVTKTQDKLNIILNALHGFDDGDYYPIEVLLVGNGAKMRSSSETRELMRILEDNGFIEVLGGLGADVAARITSLGSMSVEETQDKYKEDYSDIPDDQNELNKKIDHIIEELSKQGLGQEILFEELQELKELYGKLNKKNWGQLFKGKMLDLALAKLIENDTINFIYEEITGNRIRINH